MSDRGFRTITVSTQLYRQVQEKAKKENRKVATFVSEILVNFLYVDEKFANYVPFLELVALESGEIIVRDNKKDRIADVRAKKGANGKIELYCDLDKTDYCAHTAFAAALPQVLTAARR